MTRGNKRCWCQGSEDLQEVADPATPSTPDYEWVFPSLTVTPGPQASCLTSSAQPDVALSVSLTFNGKVTSSHHELTAALSACRSEAGEGKHDSLCTFDVIIRNFKAPAIQGETIPRHVLGDLKAILKTSAKIAWNMV